MLIPRLPVFLIDGFDIAVFRSVEELLRHVEPIDIRNREYEVYDSDGRMLQFSVQSDMGFFGEGPERVILIGVEAEPIHAAELAGALAGFLEHAGVDSGWCRNAPLPKLEEQVIAVLETEKSKKKRG